MAVIHGTNIELNKVPSLDLRFADRKNLIDTITGRNLIDFSRSSTGTYVDADGVIQSAATNDPRFDHDSDGNILGLLVEDSRTNLFTYGTKFEADWTVTFVSLTPSVDISPDGYFSATKLTPDTTVSQGHYTQQTETTTSASSFSVYAKADGYNYVWLWTSVGNAMFNLSDGTVSSAVSATANITPVGNNWYRLSVSGLAAVFSQFRIYTFPTSVTNVYAGDGTSGILIWGAQLEVGKFPTSFIPTPATFTSRDSTATYYDANGIIQTAAIDEARDDAYFPDENGVMQPSGLLLEEERTNIALNSEDFSTRFATDYGTKSSVTTNATIAPDGTQTADLVTTVTTTTQNRLGNLHAVTSGQYYTYSVYVKQGNKGSVSFYLGYTALINASMSFTFATETISTDGASYLSGSAGFDKLDNGWYRLYFTGSSFNSGNTYSGFISGTTANQTFYIWGEQIEVGKFPTSYIPTSGSTVTRSADVSSSATVTRSADITTLSNSTIGNITKGTFVFDGFNLRGRNTDSTTDPDEIGVFATFSGTNGENRILTDNNYYVSNSSSDTQTITSGQADRDIITNTPTFTSGVNRIFVSHNVTSTIGSQIIWNFTDANGLPTEVGTVLFLEIYSTRYNNGPSGSRGHNSTIKFNGSTILGSGYQAVVAGGTYERAVRKIVILTESGWEEYQNSPSITTGETASYAYAFEYDGTNTITKSMKNGTLTGGASYSGLKLPTDPVLNLNFNPSARTYKKITLYSSAMTNSLLQKLTK